MPQQSSKFVYEGIPGGTATAKAVILTALSIEHKAVEAHLEPFGTASRLSEEMHPEALTIYTKGLFKTDTCTWTVAIAQIDMGNENSAIEAIRAIEYFQPRVILFVGVAGGIKDVEIGDVVAASIVYGYECGKVVDERTLARPKLGEATYDLKQRAQAEARKAFWQERIRTGSPPQKRIPKSYVKPIAAGEKVIASRSSQIYNYLREYYSDAVAVEMEGFGFLKATQQTRNVSAIVIRGISDLINDKNDSSIESESIRQDWAARHASAFAFELLAKFYGEITVDKAGEHTDFVKIPIDEILPHHITSVALDPLEDKNFYLHAHHGKKSLVRQGELEPMLTELAELIESDNDPTNIISEIDICNGNLQSHRTCPVSQFLRWLARYSSDSQSSCLIIEDHTDLKIPWELLETDNIPIGVSTKIVRQQSNLKTPDISSGSCCQGDLLAYTNTKNSKWQKVYSCQGYSKFSEFLGYLKQAKKDYGLVFIDGFSSKKSFLKNPAAFIKRSSLFNKKNTVVFVNGQLIFDGSISLNHSKFLTLFLKYGAQGVIGTLNKLEPKVAEKVVESFFSVYQKETFLRPASVSTVLKKVRQYAYERLNDESLTDDCSTFYLAAFLYLYYGDPETTLKLTQNSS